MYKNSWLDSFILIIALAVSSSLFGCTSLNSEQTPSIQQQLKVKNSLALEQLTEQNPQVSMALANAYGYMFCDIEQLMLVALGGQSGVCILTENNQHTFLDLSTLNIGIGIGSTHQQILVLFKTQQALDSIKQGHFSLDVQHVSSFGTQDNPATSNFAQAIELYTFNQQGAAAALSLAVVNVDINQQLNTADFASINIPNKSASNKPNSTVWPYKLPLLADKALERGFKLPKPYGVGITYASIEQKMNINSLKVGFNGNDIVPFEFVGFSNTNTNLTTNQLKADMWLFPFMNVYAMVGKIDGDIEMDVLLDGNMMLEQLGDDCSGLIKPISCVILKDNVFTLPIKTQFEPLSYGVGTILAGGWQDWFFTLPLNITWNEPQRHVFDGNSITITPRVGHIQALPNLGKIALFVGANYLDSENTVSGQLSSPDISFTLDFEAKQTNADRWNWVAGFNWDITNTLSWNLEYNGFSGSRTALITGLTVRY